MSKSQLTAIIGGTGLTQYAGLQIEREEQVETPLGKTSAPLIYGSIQGQSVVFLARHGHPHNIPPHKVNYRANMLALKMAGVTRIVAVNAVGGISQQMDAQAICIPDQIIDYTHGREDTYFDGIYQPLDHVDFSYPYDAALSQALLSAANNADIAVEFTGVYGATQGPRLESAAEILRLKRDGCDIVGMTGMPEAVLARELAIPYACLALVVNKAAGMSDTLITMNDIRAALQHGIGDIQSIIEHFLLAK